MRRQLGCPRLAQPCASTHSTRNFRLAQLQKVKVQIHEGCRSIPACCSQGSEPLLAVSTESDNGLLLLPHVLPHLHSRWQKGC